MTINLITIKRAEGPTALCGKTYCALDFATVEKIVAKMFAESNPKGVEKIDLEIDLIIPEENFEGTLHWTYHMWADDDNLQGDSVLEQMQMRAEYDLEFLEGCTFYNAETLAEKIENKKQWLNLVKSWK